MARKILKYLHYLNSNAITLFDLRNFNEALVCLNRAISLNPHDNKAWTMMANTLNKLNRFDEALNCYDQALCIHPRDELTWTNKGLILSSLERTEEALECYDYALELNPDYATAWFGKGMTLLRKVSGRYHEALECLKKAEQLGVSQASHILAQL